MANPIRQRLFLSKSRPSMALYKSPTNFITNVRPVISSRTMADVAPAKPRRVRDYEYKEEEDEDRNFEFDDISSIAHGELEQHREVRHYARISTYEMPRLAQLSKLFVPPTIAQPLRFRYTTYMGEEHPAESKVVLEFAPLDLNLTPVERGKFIKLVGPRYDPDKKIVKMSCEMFEHQAQNKRYLSDLLDKLLTEAKDLSDTFEAIPFDFRHRKPKPAKSKFPYEWVKIAREKEQQRLQIQRMDS